MINVNNVYKTFQTPDRKEIKALVDFSTRIEKGEVVVVIGPSGSGKSTFLRCLNRLEEIDSGEIIIDGTNIYDKDVNINEIREEIGMVFQLFNLFPMIIHGCPVFFFLCQGYEIQEMFFS